MSGGLELAGFEVGYGAVPVLAGVDLPAWPPGVLVGLLGPNASGKSTLLKALAGQLRHRGAARFAGRDLAALPHRRRSAEVAYLPQTPPQATGLLAYEVALGTFRVAAPELSRDEVERRIAEVFELLGLDALALSRVDALSGGQRQLLGLGLVLARRTPLMLLDEPTSALDLRWQIQTLDVLRQTVAERGAYALVALHDLNLALRFCDRVVVLGGGGVLAAGPVEATMSPELLRRAYGVEARIERCSRGKPVVLADAPA